MIALSSIITTFKSAFLERYGETLLPGQRRALDAMAHCRTAASARLEAQCERCEIRALVPHSCAHRLCPHCQHHESEQWLARQLKRQVPVTLPGEFRA